MSSRFRVDVDPTLIEKHVVAYLIVSEILRSQSQPIVVSAGDVKGLVFDLRVNLSTQQRDRLIVREVEKNLPGYDVRVDSTSKTLSVVKHAGKAGRKKSPAVAQQAAVGGHAGGESI